MVRDNILQKLKKDKTQIRTKDFIQGGDDTAVFVNELLTPYFKKLFFEAKKIKNEKKYLFLWIKAGKILLKKTKEGNTIQLRSMDDLAKI